MPRRRERTGAERDAVTVEIGYALVSAAFAAAVVFGAIAGPGWVFPVSPGVADGLVVVGRAAAVVVFAVRVATVLWRFGRRPRGGGGPGGGQPSQPGRTSPDS
ncbi:DUF6332 family protein [Streptomyces sp. NPDC020875]|uniref:DUF6332 family protein n=1 Tax=Streptomyces sp. NPDC020875 TaxID=3154898 RepID=UPI0033F2ABA3